MYVIEVIPLSVLPPNVPQILSYYHDAELPKGSAVEVLVNNRRTTAIVIGANVVESQKFILRKSGFELKKISDVISAAPVVFEYQFEIALWLANMYAAPLGLSLKSVLPPFFLKKKYPAAAPAVQPERPEPTKPEIILCRAKDSYQAISKTVTESLEGQVLVLVPEMSHIPYFRNHFPEAAIIHSQISNQEFYKTWQGAADGSVHLVIGTRQALSLPFSDLRLLVVIDPLHEFYKSDLSPKYRAPDLAEMAAALHRARFLAVSDILGSENSYRIQQGQLLCRDLIKPWPAKLGVVDMVAEIKQQYVGVFAPEIKTRLGAAVKEREKILILSARRGYSGILLCEHCGFSFKCPNCDTPMRIHQGNGQILLCHRCGTIRPFPYFCPNCHSSHIKPTGPAGSQKIFEELQKMVTYGQLLPPDNARLPIVILDADITQNQTEEDEVMDTVRAKGPVIIIATQKIFSYIYDQDFDYIIVPQFDALAGFADFQANESLWYQMEKLADFNPNQFDIQTFHNTDILPVIAAHQYEKLYAEELKLRELFKYPPYSRLVKLTFSHASGQKAVTASRQLIEKLKMAASHLQARNQIAISETSPAFVKKEKGRYTATVILKVVLDMDKNLLRSILRYVPSNWLIDVDPRSAT